MTEPRNEELTREERGAFDALAANAVPPPALEERVVAALRERGLARSAPWWERVLAPVPKPARLAAAAAALVLAFVAGVEYGKRSNEAPLPEVRLEPPDGEGAAEPVTDEGGARMAAGEEVAESELRMLAGLEKPELSVLDEGHGDFPPYPLDGRPRAISPKYR
jgi:hypothetical protein